MFSYIKNIHTIYSFQIISIYIYIYIIYFVMFSDKIQISKLREEVQQIHTRSQNLQHESNGDPPKKLAVTSNIDDRLT